MADIKSPANPLFLREDELRQGIEMLFFAYRDFTAKADQTLAQFNFGRAHHRVIYFVGRNPGMTVSDLLDILKHHQAEPELARALANWCARASSCRSRAPRTGGSACSASPRRAPIWSGN